MRGKKRRDREGEGWEGEKEKYNIKTVVMNHVCATIGAHSGPGTVALFFVGDMR